MSPHEAWTTGLMHGAEGGGAVDRYLPPSSIEVESAFSASSKRRLSHKGIEYDCLFYNSAELGYLRENWGSEIAVEVRTQDDDLGSMIVVAPDGQTIIRVPALNQEYAAGLTRWQHAVCKRFQRNQREDDATEISLLDAKSRIRALVEQDIFSKRKVRTRARQQRFMETEHSASPAPGDHHQKSNALSSSHRTTQNEPSSRGIASDTDSFDLIPVGPDEAIPDLVSRRVGQ